MAEQAVAEGLPPDQVLVEGEDPQQKDMLVNDAGEEIQARPAAAAVDDEDDDRIVQSQAENAEESGKSESEREAIRERRREEKKRKRENFQNMKRELSARDTAINQLQEQINVLQRKSSGGEIAQIDSAIKQTSEAYAYFKNQIAEATARADGPVVAEATERLMQAHQKFQQLNQIKQGYQKQQSAPAPLDPRLIEHAQGWMEEHDWYDPAAKDDDSEIVRTLDNKLAQEGWDPKTPEYWEELSRRGKKYLPHRFTSGSKQSNIPSNTRPRQTVGGSGREGSSGAGAGFVLSAARVSAIKEAGAWDDPKRRTAMISRFKEYDKNNRT